MTYRIGDDCGHGVDAHSDFRIRHVQLRQEPFFGQSGDHCLEQAGYTVEAVKIHPDSGVCHSCIA